MQTHHGFEHWIERLARLIAAANIVFIAIFILTLIAATGAATARAQAETSCGGADLIAEMAEKEPARLAAIRKEAAATLNGGALLWRIEGAGAAPSYLYGTMHVTDPRVVELPPAAEQAFEVVDTLVIETTDVLDPAAMMATLAEAPELMMFTDGTTLGSLLAPKDRSLVDAALEERGIPPASITKMKPWMIAAMVSLPPCEAARKAAGEEILDLALARRAEADGKEVLGLETMKDQLEAMARLPMEFHVQGLVDTLKLGSRMNDVVETMTLIYISGKPGMFWPFIRAVLPGSGAAEAGIAAFEESLITARNRKMAASAEPILAKGGAFVAVGALHLPGEEGLVALLRGRGFTLEPVAIER